MGVEWTGDMKVVGEEAEPHDHFTADGWRKRHKQTKKHIGHVHIWRK